MSAADDVVRRSIRTARDLVTQRAEATLVHEVRITRTPAAGTVGGDGMLAWPDGDQVYAGPAKLGPGRGPVTYEIGEEIDFFTSAAASVPLDVTAVQVDDILQVTGHDDARYVGLFFRIVDVESAGILGPLRKLQLVGVARSQHWVDALMRHPSAQAPETIPPEWRLG